MFYQFHLPQELAEEIQGYLGPGESLRTSELYPEFKKGIKRIQKQYVKKSPHDLESGDRIMFEHPHLDPDLVGKTFRITMRDVSLPKYVLVDDETGIPYDYNSIENYARKVIPVHRSTGHNSSKYYALSQETDVYIRLRLK